MVDTMTIAERSKRMALIRSKDTKPEMTLRRSLHRAGLRYRLHSSDLPGKPDIVFVAARTSIFVNGCFWHGHKCSIGHFPKTNSAFWTAKILTNRNRDARNIRSLRNLGWKVFVVWECELNSKMKVERKTTFLTSKLIAKRELARSMKARIAKDVLGKKSQGKV